MTIKKAAWVILGIIAALCVFGAGWASAHIPTTPDVGTFVMHDGILTDSRSGHCWVHERDGTWRTLGKPGK
jgi:hypothetical protein